METGAIEEEVVVIVGAVAVVVAAGTGVAEKIAGVAEMREGEEEDDTEVVVVVAVEAGVVMEVTEEAQEDKMSLKSLQLVRDNHMTNAWFQVFIDRILAFLSSY